MKTDPVAKAARAVVDLYRADSQWVELGTAIEKLARILDKAEGKPPKKKLPKLVTSYLEESGHSETAAREYLATQRGVFDGLERKATDLIGWVQFKTSTDRKTAKALVEYFLPTAKLS